MPTRFFASLCVFTLFPMSAGAQLATTTSLVGTVIDSSGKVIPGARVTSVRTATLDTHTTTTNDPGYYTFEFVRVGTYSVTIEHPGFQKITKTGIQVDIN